MVLFTGFVYKYFCLNIYINGNNAVYKKCYKTLAKSVHPDEGGDTEAMKCLNQLKVMWEI